MRTVPEPILVLSQSRDPDDASHDDLNEQLRLAEREALEARAGYMLRNKIIENVLIADPILQAVHTGSRATSAER